MKVKTKYTIVSMMMLLGVTTAQAQITIAGSVYGGGNAGDMTGSSKVTVRAGDINAVFGGARMANVNGSAFVHIDGEHASDNIFISNVYGGNDIAGTIGTDDNTVDVPSELTKVGTTTGLNNIDGSWNAFVRTSPTPVTDDPKDRLSLVIGSLFGGGNGDYGDSGSDNKYTTGDYIDFTKPVLGKTYLEILGGCIAHLYGGGNNATINKNTTICIDNISPVLTETNVYPTAPTAPGEGATEEETAAYATAVANYKATLVALAQKVKMTTFQSNLDSYSFNFARVFGGNNKAEMKIRPIWNLQNGIIRDLYSGGNQGDMTSPEGLLLNIDAGSNIVVENLYGGCRMADVKPTDDKGNYKSPSNLPGYNFPDGFSARVVISGGDVNNVYGGNDITGKVYGGNAVGIRASVRGDVYGGGNGSYAYTDNATLGAQELFKDFYYNPGSNSAGALNGIRPNAEQVSIRVVGSEDKPTIVHGGIYCGGNSATIMSTTTNPRVELKIGSYVIADSVFLGNNGANMVKESILKLYAGSVNAATGELVTSGGTDYSSLTLTDAPTFATYMDGAAMKLMPSVVFDGDAASDGDYKYEPYTAYFGSFFCGGNVGSMIRDGKTTINFNKPVIIYNKVAGGCNNANIYQSSLNAEYLGGLLGATDTNGNKLELNFNGLKIQPMRWKYVRDGEYNIVEDENGNATYDTDLNGNHQLEWNTVSAATGKDVAPVTGGATVASPVNSTSADLDRRFKGGNIYGGCYNSGHVNGNVVINLNATIHERENLFDVASNEGDINYDNVEKAEEDPSYYHITKRNSGVLLSHQGTDVFGGALNVFGGGFGGDSEIWGSTTINLNKGYTFQIFGGGEKGAIGKAISHVEDPNDPTRHILTYEYNAANSTYINLNGDVHLPGVKRDTIGDSPDMAECEYLYGGAFEGVIAGNTHVYLNNGRIFDSFGGSCNANILGHTETYVGQNGFPYVRAYVYGGNDLGGLISEDAVNGPGDFEGRIRGDVVTMVDPAVKLQTKTVAAYTEYIKGRVDYIIGGSSGNYDYKDPLYRAGTGAGYRVATLPKVHNTFVNIRPVSYTGSEIAKVFGGGEGYPGNRDGDELQDHSYVLIDIPSGIENFANTEVFGAGAYNGLGMRYTPAQTFDSGFDLNEASAIVDLMRGEIGAAYGGSYEEGITRRTLVNVPVGSSINITNIFGGAYGTHILPPCDVYESNVNYHSNDATVTGAIYGGNNSERRTLYAHVNITSPVWSNKASGYLAKVYGAGKGKDTWSEYTEVNLLPKPDGVTGDYTGAKVYEVYGGGEMGHVLNSESVMKYMQTYKDLGKPSDDIIAMDPKWSNNAYWVLDEHGNKQSLKTGKLNEDDEKTIPEMWLEDWKNAWTFGQYYTPVGEYTRYATNEYMNLSNSYEVRTAEMDERDHSAYDYATGDDDDAKAAKDKARARIDHKYNTNVIIHKGATVEGYAYGGGLGEDKTPLSGDVYGSTYIALLGGTVTKDLYAAGTTGAVYDLFGVKNRFGINFIASANAYIKGGSARNVYGGGWKGSVGYHNGDIDDDYYVTDPDESNYGELLDIPGETHVVIGILKDDLPANPKTPEQEGYDPNFHFYNGIPIVERNAYGGGEGGAVWGTANITMNNGYIGYTYNKNGTDAPATANIDERYEEKIVDDTYKDEDGHFQDNKRLNDAGCIFGGGYIDNSSVDFTNVKMYGGHVRNALFGGGEIAAIGRGKIQETTGANGKKIRTLVGIYRPGGTDIQMFDGHVHRNVFGGGRGYNNLGESGNLYSDGYVFGQTKVHIHGGEIGTLDELNKGNGNVFGGGDIGYVYSAYEYDDGNGHKLPRKGMKSGVRYDGGTMSEGYYYEHDWADDGNYILYGSERKLTEDCEVLIAPSCKVTAANATFNIKYYQGQVLSDNDFNYIQTEGTEELKGKIDAFGKVTAEGGLSMTRTFYKGEYVPTSALNTLGNREESATEWAKLEANTNDDGILIHNAVFAGGNTTKGADNVNAFAGSYSVYGNVTASIHDAYHRDLITIGTGHIGGLYGDGNLTLVDGYRGLNITNYGTDYHYLYEEEGKSEMSITEYNALLDREQNYYELRYKCMRECRDIDGTTYHPEGGDYSKASTLTLDDIMTLFPATVPTPNPNNYSVPAGLYNTDGSLNEGEGAYWKQNGVCSIYAGRILNTIQRADFCGVFGSRMVMQGAQDRVPEVVDYTKYTINRVREVSLNKKRSVIQADINQSDDSSNKYRFRKQHGNYFGIYSIVNYLGALTSDFDFGDQGDDSDADDAAGRVTNSNGTFSTLPGNNDVGTGDARTSDNINTGTYGPQYTGQTFYGWKRFHHDDRDRNNGNSHNKVALASGVYLELTTEQSTGKDLYEKVWGPITGVVELDLINVQQGLGGGFVYAKNIHGVRTKTNRTNTTLTALNAGAVTQWDYTYAEPSTISDAADSKQREWQTSGNFVHSTQTIIDDCYNVSNRYKGANRVPAHYWYIKGSVYVYDQYISAYTGVTNAYSEKVEIPLTITAASHGQMKLLNVQPNRYAYYNTNGEKLSGDQKLIINDIEYKLNDPISYWDWYKLTAAEKKLFEKETYVSIAKYKYREDDVNEYPADAVLLPADYTTITTNAHHKVDEEGHEVKDENNDPILELWDVEEEEYVPVESIIRPSNNLSHDTGYILTYRVNNPTDWDTWYTEYSDASNTSAAREKKQDKSELVAEIVGGIEKGPNEGPTYRLKSGTGELLGQRTYKISDIISEDVKTTYDAIPTNQIPSSGQATFQRAWVATGETDITRSDQTVHLYKGSTMSATEAGTSTTGNKAEAFICTKTIKLDGTDNIYINSIMTGSEKTTHLGNVNTAISTLVGEINTVLTENSIDNINAETIYKISDLTPAQLNAITPLQKKELNDLLTRKKDINDCILPAYYCTFGGPYGGNYYQGGINYRGLEAWSSMSEEDRDKFIFNYDALDLLIDPTYDNNDASKEGKKYQYDGATYNSENDKITSFSTEAQATTNLAGYSIEQHVDYTATYNGDNLDLTAKGLSAITVTRNNTETSVTVLQSGDELSRSVFETLPNDQRHYAPITVTSTDLGTNGTCTFYIVNDPLLIGPTPYTAGNIISKADYDGLSDTEKTKVTPIEFNEAGTYYFCREAYTPPSGSHSTVKGVVGSQISSTVYGDLTNLQKNFTIHGIAPTETSTLYVSRFSDIDDLSKEKIITVIYEYNYEESDVSGLHITPVTERHVLNIHINFKTGAPIVKDIDTPPIVIPGQLLSLLPPEVIEGASPVQGGGWELYPTPADADNHNGIDYVPDADKLYWYQNGYWLRYYALSYVGGKTYSNKVQVSVANFHDLKKVMEDKANHYYIDIPDLNRLRDPKIYIRDDKDGMNQLKNLFDLSLQTAVATTGPTKDHALLKSQVKQCENLEFIMQTNVNHTGAWTPIGQIDDPETTDVDEGICFKGNIHGDGYYIRGLNNSLFANLCGNVYNLGVKGSFTGAGVVDEGIGYVENCWTNTTGTPNGSVYAVFGNPNDTENPSAKQIVNSYYQEGKSYKTTGATHGLAIPKPDEAFYNGEVAYDLNGFYLWKRYWDHDNASGGTAYRYYTGETDSEGNLVPKTESYGSNITYCSTGYIPTSPPEDYVVPKYVEDRYADGDFRYANYQDGDDIISSNERLYTDKDDENKTKFYPIWPDDYLFFGQMLTYGWDDFTPHEDVPSHIVKDDNGRLNNTDGGNRVFRAPAYFQSSTMGVAHFNPWANLAAKSADGTRDVYPRMTAIDFAGHNDNHWAYGAYGADETYGTGAFYPPLLDDNGLIGIANRDETKNLLVYAPAETAATEDDYANKATYDVLNDYFIGSPESRTEPIYSEHTESNTSKFTDGKTYGRIAIANTSTVHGHLVQSNLTTTTDHLLVDKQDFDCPIQYSMGSGYHMWYQRIPGSYVDYEWVDHDNNAATPPVRNTKGWEGISLPFTTKTVATQDKGELTHFYQGSMKGHEYWLRGYAGNVKQKTGAATGVMEADFNPMAAGTNTKVYTNTFLWDYYYSKDSYWDKNVDEYQKQYYSADYLSSIYGTVGSPKVTNYPYSQGGTPYLIGFPGDAYYEFDLSGEWTPKNRYEGKTITSPGKQTVTFVSVEGDEIHVSDGEKAGVVAASDYAFKPNYLNKELENGKFAMNNDGDAYNILDNATATWNTTGATYATEAAFNEAGTLYSDADGTTKATTWANASTTYYTRISAKATKNEVNGVTTSLKAFRPYFAVASGGSARQLTRSIVFRSDNAELKGVEERDNPKEVGGTLEIYSKKHLIVVESALTYTVNVTIVNTAGIIVNKFTINPGETIETRVNNAGVYIVQPSELRFTKKLSVR